MEDFGVPHIKMEEDYADVVVKYEPLNIEETNTLNTQEKILFPDVQCKREEHRYNASNDSNASSNAETVLITQFKEETSINNNESDTQNLSDNTALDRVHRSTIILPSINTTSISNVPDIKPTLTSTFHNNNTTTPQFATSELLTNEDDPMTADFVEDVLIEYISENVDSESCDHVEYVSETTKDEDDAEVEILCEIFTNVDGGSVELADIDGGSSSPSLNNIKAEDLSSKCRFMHPRLVFALINKHTNYSLDFTAELRTHDRQMELLSTFVYDDLPNLISHEPFQLLIRERRWQREAPLGLILKYFRLYWPKSYKFWKAQILRLGQVFNIFNDTSFRRLQPIFRSGGWVLSIKPSLLSEKDKENRVHDLYGLIESYRDTSTAEKA